MRSSYVLISRRSKAASIGRIGSSTSRMPSLPCVEYVRIITASNRPLTDRYRSCKRPDRHAAASEMSPTARSPCPGDTDDGHDEIAGFVRFQRREIRFGSEEALIAPVGAVCDNISACEGIHGGIAVTGPKSPRRFGPPAESACIFDLRAVVAIEREAVDLRQLIEDRPQLRVRHRLRARGRRIGREQRGRRGILREAGRTRTREQT